MPRYHDVLIFSTQTKSIGGGVSYKRIQGGIQPDISLRFTSNIDWKALSLELRPYGRASKTRFRFRVEEEYGSKVWTKPCKSCVVQPWLHKQYTSVRVQFCKEYYEERLQFTARVQIARVGAFRAVTEVPIILVASGDALNVAYVTD